MLLRRAITGHKGLLALTVFLGILMASASELSIEVIPPKPQENQNVILNITGITDTILFSEWYQGKDIPATHQIIRYNRNGPINRGGKYFDRAEIYGSGSLLIKNVTMDLEGDYTVSIQGSTKLYQQTVNLKLYVFPSILIASAASELSIEVIPPKPQENQNVILNITGITDTILFSEWYQGKDIPATHQIIRYNRNGPINRGGKYFDRAEIYGSGSLLIKNVTNDLEGDYTVSIQGSTKLYQQTVNLKLYGDEDSRLSGGAIAGIVIGVISVVVALIGGAIYLSKKKDSV